MRIYYLFIASIAMTIMTAVALVFLAVTTARNKKYALENTLAAEPCSAWASAAIIAIILACVFAAAFAGFKATAKAYGAYGDTYDKTETIGHILSQVKYGYKDQSDELPADIDGKILIMFKYGCSDCNDTHDQLMKTLRTSGVDMNDVWFISSKSEKGSVLMGFYGLEYVPAAIYQNIDSKDEHTARVVYDTTEWQNPDAKYLESEMLAVIDAYKADHTAHIEDFIHTYSD